jgi:hypothetical protein
MVVLPLLGLPAKAILMMIDPPLFQTSHVPGTKGSSLSGCLFQHPVSFHRNGIRQLLVDAVSAILDGHHTSASAAGDHGNGFAAVATQRKQERIQFLIVGFNAPDDVFLSQLRSQ